ncbi:MAG: septum formation initiator family protein [Gemmatimonadota bacterium]|nr:septum formation initiator family protein [Gemmatimonadota bacterium]MDH3367756.1 septum formation initiator family protein [Gemmatimonadota bacterium]MDH3477900.1 septum formation initiator family protein [Gemmatimonadota bacterium]MDH3571822.1 septum formation initiator family protein [Gemmatimonadota bacterium]MDH5550634.1 septum formation initiator family protein [Gemmatimonadota bacterium]
MRLGRVLAAAVVVGGLAFGVFGGEYGTLDWWQLRREMDEQRQAIVRLRAEVDSLAKWAHLLESDPATQERVARELFGYIRPGEMLYRVERAH